MHPKTHWAEIEIRSARFPPSVFKAPYLFSNRVWLWIDNALFPWSAGPYITSFLSPWKKKRNSHSSFFSFQRPSFCQIVFSWVYLCWFLFPAFFSQSPMEFPVPCFLPKKRAVDSINLLLWIGLFLLFYEKGQIPQSSLSGNAYTAL